MEGKKGEIIMMRTKVVIAFEDENDGTIKSDKFDFEYPFKNEDEWFSKLTEENMYDLQRIFGYGSSLVTELSKLIATSYACELAKRVQKQLDKNDLLFPKVRKKL